MPTVFSGRLPVPSNKWNEDGETHAGAKHSFGVVYANDHASEALKAEPPIQFPRGSIFVREKLKAPDDKQPQHLMVMIKRAPGFNPPGNDWEFLSVDGAMTKIEKRQKKGSCLDCHASQKARDFVFREPPKAVMSDE